MRTIEDQLILHEGLRLKPYTDTVGKLTIGIGHNLTDKGLTQAQCVSILRDDLADTTSFLNSHCPWYANLDPIRQKAILDLTFNLMGKLLDFHNMIAAIQAQDWNRAADELLNSTFAHQTGVRAQHLAQMLRTGQDF